MVPKEVVEKEIKKIGTMTISFHTTSKENREALQRFILFII